MELSFEELLKKINELTSQGLQWHHHYLPPNCSFSSSDKHQIALESAGKRWQASFDYKPMQELEKVDILFRKQ